MKRIFVFTNGAGETHRTEAENITEAWVKLARFMETSPEVLVEQGWNVDFRPGAVRAG